MHKPILLDMDGVLADFVGGALKAHGIERFNSLHWPPQWDMATELGISDDEFWAPIHDGGAEFWRQLEPLPWAQELWDGCAALGSITISTSPSRDYESRKGKLDWLAQHFDANVGCYFGRDKWLMARHGILIDDSDANVQRFCEKGGQAVLFPRPWNALAFLARNPLEHVFHQLRLILDFPKKAA